MKDYKFNLKIYDEEMFNNDNCAQVYAHYLETFLSDRQNCICYYNEPDYKVKGNLLPTFTILDKEYGIIVIKLFNFGQELQAITSRYWIINGAKRTNYLKFLQDYVYTFESDVNVPSNELDRYIKINIISVFPLVDKNNVNNEINDDNLIMQFNNYMASNLFNKLKKINLSENDWNKVNSIVEKANILNSGLEIDIDMPANDLNEAILLNNNRINRFDDVQLDASWTITENSERIRGLAGTGKTVILAIKAAKLHKKYPNKKIAFVFYTQALYNQVNELVNKYFYKIAGSYPNPQYLKILHAWGGRTVGPGFYYNTCLNNDIVPLTFYQVKNHSNPFGAACSQLLDKNIKEEYDVILIDEAQDLPSEFFKLAAKTLKSPKKIVIAYDELQTTNDTEMLEFEDLFGKDESGNAIIKLNAKYDYILKKSYRNNIKVLMTAFAFGFGLYGDIVQIIDNINTWEALGFKVVGDVIPYSQKCTILREKENNPNNITDFYNDIPIISFSSFDTKQLECKNTIDTIFDLVKNQNVKPEEIMVIDMSNNTEFMRNIQDILLNEYSIKSNIPGIDDDAKQVKEPDHVTITTPRRAKGNEVSIAIVTGVQSIYKGSTTAEKRILRNMLFVSITRSKGWVFLSASGENANKFREEFDKIQADINKDTPEFNFQFPSKKRCMELSRLNYILKKSDKEQEINNILKNLEEIIDSNNADIYKLFINDNMKKKILDFAKKLKDEEQ